ncbi:MAG: Hypothetical protein BHV28_10370 [Candidatus Tokpelaia hoelldobleri]|uniref:DUF2877 domain-containing protein n=1 Tax=Candidatus Tokpelaia hoelldobleri TaxID=1902579 RepID=A0A1U9JV45_9HYPH|nr:MAG: Hypothetical protein BHV28_10370 [Candidatus Tokpelaia hoelldoblerii]
MKTIRMRHKQIIFPLRSLGFSAAAWQRLLPDTPAQILSVFRRGMTVLPQNDPHGRPIFISPPGEGLLPEHIILSKQDFMRLVTECRAGDLVSITRRRCFQLKMPRFQADPATLQEGLRVLQADIASQGLTGLHVTCGDILRPEWEWSDVFNCSREWAASAQTGTSRQIVLRRLIGRGSGSTPAGDDMLVGALAFLQAWKDAPCEQTFFPALCALERDLLQLTTQTSEVYLHWALKGVFSSDIIRLMTALMTGDKARIKRACGRLLNHGDTSGLDTLTGVVLMIRGSGILNHK